MSIQYSTEELERGDVVTCCYHYASTTRLGNRDIQVQEIPVARHIATVAGNPLSPKQIYGRVSFPEGMLTGPRHGFGGGAHTAIQPK